MSEGKGEKKPFQMPIAIALLVGRYVVEQF